MKIQLFVDKVNGSSQFKEFKKKYGDAFLAAGFFVLDLEMGKNISQIDYYIPSEKKFAAFTLGGDKVNLQIIDSLTEKAPEKLDFNTKIDLESIPGILEDEMKNRNITEDIKKIIAVVQTIKGKKVWNINSVLSGMDILRAHIEDSSQTILKMEKTSFVDIMKKIPIDQLPMPKMRKGGEGQEGDEGEENIAGGNAEGGDSEEAGVENEDEAIEELKKLDKLEGEIEKEKSRLKKAIIEKEKNGSSNLDKKETGKEIAKSVKAKDVNVSKAKNNGKLNLKLKEDKIKKK